MTAPDRPQDPNGERYPSRATVEVLRAALIRYLGGVIEDDQVRDALAVLAREAQERRLHAEQMIVAFKQVWNEMPDVQAIHNLEERKSLLDRLVKLCIDAYYTR